MDVTVLQDFDVREFEKTVADYNRAAKHAKQPSVDFMHQVGNTIIVNGATWPWLPVEQRRYRLRLLNGCNADNVCVVVSR